MSPLDKAQALREKVALLREEVAALREYFADLFPPEYLVSDAQFGIWIRQYGFDYAVIAFEEGSKKLNKMQQEIEEGRTIIDKETGEKVAQEVFTRIGLVKFLSWVMIDKKEKAEKA